MASNQQRSIFMSECLERTNELRLRHGSPALKLNQKLSDVAQKWADILVKSNILSHNPSASYLGSPLGENIAFNYKSSMNVTGSEMIDQWYNEIAHYNFNTHTSNKTTGHFTQLVWKNSKEVGFGLAVSKVGKHYLVANYYPAGNYVGQNRENVFPPRDGKIRIEPKEKYNDTNGYINAGKPNQSGRRDLSPRKTSYIRTFVSEEPELEENNWSFKVAKDDDDETANNKDFWKTETSKFYEFSDDGNIKNSSKSFSSARIPASERYAKDTFTSDFASPHRNKLTANNDLSNFLHSKLQLEDKRTGNNTNRTTTTNYNDSKNYFGSKEPSKNSSTVTVKEISYGPGHSKMVKTYTTGERNLGDDYLTSTFSTRPAQTSYGYKATDLRGIDDNENRSKSPYQFATSSYVTSVEKSNATSEQQTLSQFVDDVVSCHNKYRRKHGSIPTLVHNPQLSKAAQQWAETLTSGNLLRQSGNKFQGQQLGENLACKYSSVPVDYTGSELVEHWYSEKDNYNYNYPNETSNLSKIGHFTQMVWKDSREIGVGKAWSRDRKKVFVVCNYFPPGNVLGCFKENVLR